MRARACSFFVLHNSQTTTTTMTTADVCRHHQILANADERALLLQRDSSLWHILYVFICTYMYKYTLCAHVCAFTTALGAQIHNMLGNIGTPLGHY